jgi:hypothetical protein
MLNKFLNEKSLSKNIYTFIGYLVLSVLIYILGQNANIPIYLNILISCLFLIRALLGGYCIIKLLINKS